MKALYFCLLWLVSLCTGQDDCFHWGLEYHGGGLDNPLVTGVTSPDSCQLLCQDTAQCQHFTWVSSQHEAPDYRNTCWLKETTGNPQQCSACVSGPRSCDDVTTTTEGGESTPCCRQVTVDSTGDTVDYQWTRLGQFEFKYNSEGRPVYFMEEHNQWLYFQTWVNVWYVGDQPLQNMGGLINWDQASCPEDITSAWSFYRWGDGEVNDWEEDPQLRVTCGWENGVEDTTTTTRRPVTSSTTTRDPGPDTEPCTWGDACQGCAVTTETGGVTFCCSTHCDSGDVWVWGEDGAVECACSH